MEWKKLNIKELELFIKHNKHGLSNKEIADKLKISKNTLMYSIRNEVIKLSIFQDLCEILHTNPSIFFNVSKNPITDKDSNYEGQSMKGRFVPIEVYDEMKEQMRGEIKHLREANLILMNNIRQTDNKEKN